MKNIISFFFLFSLLHAAAFADTATVVIQIFPADTGSYVLSDKQASNPPFIQFSGAFSGASIKLSIPWPENNTDSMVSCVLTCNINVQGFISISIPVPVERNKEIRILINHLSFYKDVSLKDKVKTNYYGSVHAMDFDQLWNGMLEQLSEVEKLSKEDKRDTSRLHELLQSEIDHLGSYIKKYPGSGFWKVFLTYDLSTESDENARQQYLSLVPAGFCNRCDTGIELNKALCNEIGRNTKPCFQLDYNLPDPGNRYHHSRKEEGKVLLVDYWATWCMPCLKERAELRKIYSAFKSAEKFQLISISLDKDRPKWEKYLRNNPMDWQQLIDENGVMQKKYNIVSIPDNMIVDESGKILYKGKSMNEVVAILTELLKEKPGSE